MERDIGAAVPNWRPPPTPEFTELGGRFTRLERLVPQHADELFQAFEGAESNWAHLPYGPFDRQGYRDWVASVAGLSDPVFLAVRDRGGIASGVLSFLRITPQAGSIEVGHINFAPRLKRTPAATEAIFLLLDWAFGAGYRRFEWKCDALNLASRRAAERFGFSFEGVFRQATVVKGRNRDTAWFATIDQEWDQLRAAYDTWLSPDNFGADGQQKRRLSDLTAPILVARDPVLSD